MPSMVFDDLPGFCPMVYGVGEAVGATTVLLRGNILIGFSFSVLLIFQLPRCLLWGL